MLFLQMGICYGWGMGGVNASDVLEHLYYKKAYESGCDDAYSYIGQLYLYGSAKVKKDLQKAEDFLRQGVEKGVDRCYEKLFYLYCNKNEHKKALEILQYMIENNIKGGYSLMGEYYHYHAPEIDRDRDKAIDYYQQAVNHNEKNAWGNLAWTYWEDGENEEAYRMAQKGCLENDGSSYYILGYFYEQDTEFPKAWNCYQERVQRFGYDASPLANLYLNQNYLPKDYKLEDLKHLLEIDVKHQRVESIVCLLKIILKEHNREPLLDLTFYLNSLKLMNISEKGQNKETPRLATLT